MSLLITSIIFLLLYGLLFRYYFQGWKKAGQELISDGPTTFLSVLVPARNEEEHISSLLKALKEQSYPQSMYEVIVIDDFSTDGTSHAVKQNASANLQLIQPDTKPGASSKKKAIEAGIRKAKGELIVTTDADCIPGVDWLQGLNDHYKRTGAAFIAAPVQYQHHHSLLHIFQSLDFLTLQGITAASVSSQFHSMCNGANLAYTREAFFSVNGFEGIDRVASGDDMLLMHKIWKSYPGRVYYLKNKKAIVQTQPMKTWKEFFMQRKRWASKTLVYDDYRVIVVLAFVYLFNLLFLALVIASFFNPLLWLLVFLYWIVKAGIEFLFLMDVAQFFNERKLLPYLFLLQPLHIFYTAFIGIYSQLGSYEWKGRRTK